MLACIGDRFTMGPERAAEAVKLVEPATVIPMHYATLPVLTVTPKEIWESGSRAISIRGGKATRRIHSPSRRSWQLRYQLPNHI